MENITGRLSDDAAVIEAAFRDCADIVMRYFKAGKNKDITLYMVYTDNIVNGEAIRSDIMTNIMNRSVIQDGEAADILRQINNYTLAIGEMNEIKTYAEVIDAALNGDTVLLADGCAYALQASTKGYPTRGVPKAETEVVVQGPKDAFTEASSTNIVLIRRRIKDYRLKLQRKSVGTRSKTDVAVMYMEGIARAEIVDEAMKKIYGLNIDAIFDSGYLAQLIEGSAASPFPQIQLTERPDKAAAALLEGRIVVVVDNAPFVLMIPSTMNEFFQSAEDYYDRWEIMSFLRILRYAAAFLAVTLPGLFIATTLFHPSMLPTALALKIAATRQNVPFPTVAEVVMMELAFELLREAGVRLPSPVSSTIGIVGGIIIGQAAVDAGLVSPSVVIISALTGICTFVIPNNALVSGLRLSKYIVIALSALFGLLGLWLGVILLIIHLSSLKSFGVPYLYPYCSPTASDYSDLKDSVFRVPLFMMKKRPVFAKPSQRIRQRKEGRK